MTEDSNTKNSIELHYVRRDIERIEKNLTNQMTALSNEIKGMANTFATQANVNREIERLQDHINKVENYSKKKLDVEDFEPYKSALNRVNWIIIASVISGLLALIITNS